jgi:hypothetical protein
VVLAGDLSAYLEKEAAEAWSGWLERHGRAPAVEIAPDLAPGTWRIEEAS